MFKLVGYAALLNYLFCIVGCVLVFLHMLKLKKIFFAVCLILFVQSGYSNVIDWHSSHEVYRAYKLNDLTKIKKMYSEGLVDLGSLINNSISDDLLELEEFSDHIIDQCRNQILFNIDNVKTESGAKTFVLKFLIKNGDIKEVTEAIAKLDLDKSEINSSAQNAAYYGKFEIVKLLITMGADSFLSILELSSNKMSLNEYIQIIDLVKAEKNIKQDRLNARLKDSAENALYFKNQVIVKYLLDNYPHIKLNELLPSAVQSGDIAMVNFLVNRGADDYFTIVRDSIYRGYFDIFSKYFLQAKVAEKFAELIKNNQQGEVIYLLDAAISSGRIEFYDFLIASLPEKFVTKNITYNYIHGALKSLNSGLFFRRDFKYSKFADNSQFYQKILSMNSFLRSELNSPRFKAADKEVSLPVINLENLTYLAIKLNRKQDVLMLIEQQFEYWTVPLDKHLELRLDHFLRYLFRSSIGIKKIHVLKAIVESFTKGNNKKYKFAVDKILKKNGIYYLSSAAQYDLSTFKVMLEVLQENNISISAKDYQELFSDSYASKSFEVANYILANFEINDFNEALLASSTRGHYKDLQRLIDLGADNLDEALKVAVKLGRDLAVKILKENGAK